MKKVISLLLIFAMILSPGYMAKTQTRLMSKNNKYGKFTYSLYRIGDCAIRIVACLDSYNGAASHVKLPAKIDGRTEVDAPPSRYKHPKKIKKITLEGRLSYYGEFASLPNLKTIQMKKNSRSSYAKKGVLFYDLLGGIRLVAYPRGKKEKSYRIPEKVKVIGPYAFTNCKNLKSITLPKGLLEINEYAFYGCKSLKKITVPKWVSYIGPGAFKKCKARVVMSPYMKKVKDATEEEAHYELFVDSRPKDEPDAEVRQVAFRDMDEIQPDVKQVEMTAKSRHTLVTHFKIGQDWHTLLSDGLQYKSSSPEVATVDDHGIVTAKEKGTTKITVEHLYLYGYHNYAAGQYNVKVTVK